MPNNICLQFEALFRGQKICTELFLSTSYECSAYSKNLQSEISLPEFQDAEPDILVHSTSAILKRFNQNCDDALKALCKKKGLDVEVIQFFNI